MAEYLSPGVYVEEFDSGVKEIAGVGTSTAGFIGLAERGALLGRPTLVKSFGDYRKHFEGYLSELEHGNKRFLAYAVDSFFANGGSSCYIMRVASEDAKKAKNNIEEKGKIKIFAKSHGAWGNKISIRLEKANKCKTQLLSSVNLKTIIAGNSSGFNDGDVILLKTMVDGKKTEVFNVIASVEGNRITLKEDFTCAIDHDVYPMQHSISSCDLNISVRYDDIEENFEFVSLNPISTFYINTKLEKSDLISFTYTPDEEIKSLHPLEMLGGEKDAKDLSFTLSGGEDGSGLVNYKGVDNGPGKRSGIEAFQEVTDVSIMAVPGICDPNVQAALVEHCEAHTNRFAILDVDSEIIGVDALLRCKEIVNTSYAAMYHPWLQVFDPLEKKNIYIPPSGAMAGIYARTDNSRGVHKAPANEIVRNCTGLKVTYNEVDQSKLNPKGINLIRSIPGQGIRVWGARTCSTEGNWKYINVRRLFIYIEESIKANTSWVVSEPNDEALWSRVSETVKMFLNRLWRDGALLGSSPDEAFFVNIGRSTMTDDDLLNGRLICVIGVAAVRPAEFTVFKITQKIKGAL